MTLELPQGRNANAAAVNDVVAEVDNGEASIDEAPNTHLIILNFLFTACIAPWIIAK